MRDKDCLNLFESYKQVTESGDFEGGVRLHKPTGEWERLVDYLIQKGHDEDEAKTLANGFLKNRRDVKPVDQVQSEDGSEFSTDPEHEDYDKVTHLLDQLVSAELDYNSDSEEEAVSSLIARLMEHPSYIGNDSAVGSPPNDGRFPRGE